MSSSGLMAPFVAASGLLHGSRRLGVNHGAGASKRRWVVQVGGFIRNP